jgi:hypothetical protein
LTARPASFSGSALDVNGKRGENREGLARFVAEGGFAAG